MGFSLLFYCMYDTCLVAINIFDLTWLEIINSMCNGSCRDRSQVADSRTQRLNHWALNMSKVPEWPSPFGLALSLHYPSLVFNRGRRLPLGDRICSDWTYVVCQGPHTVCKTGVGTLCKRLNNTIRLGSKHVTTCFKSSPFTMIGSFETTTKHHEIRREFQILLLMETRDKSPWVSLSRQVISIHGIDYVE